MAVNKIMELESVSSLGSDDYIEVGCGSDRKLRRASAELIRNNIQANKVTATFTVGDEAANQIDVAVQLVDGNGVALTAAAAIQWYLADDATGLTPSTSGPDTLAAGTDGAIVENVANLSGMAVSEADGDIDFAITSTSTPTFYLVIVGTDASLNVSDAITFAS